MVINLKDYTKTLQLIYQQRYAEYLKAYDHDHSNMDAHGHAMECSFVLISLFGLNDDEVRQLEKNDYAGLLDRDLE